jgi:hypothetical protein
MSASRRITIDEIEKNMRLSQKYQKRVKINEIIKSELTKDEIVMLSLDNKTNTIFKMMEM